MFRLKLKDIIVEFLLFTLIFYFGKYPSILWPVIGGVTITLILNGFFYVLLNTSVISGPLELLTSVLYKKKIMRIAKNLQVNGFSNSIKGCKINLTGQHPPISIGISINALHFFLEKEIKSELPKEQIKAEMPFVSNIVKFKNGVVIFTGSINDDQVVSVVKKLETVNSYS